MMMVKIFLARNVKTSVKNAKLKLHNVQSAQLIEIKHLSVIVKTDSE